MMQTSAEDQLNKMILTTSTLMQRFEQRCAQLEQQQQQLTHVLNQLAQQVPQVIRNSADNTLQSLPSAVVGKLGDSLSQPVDDYDKRVRSAGQSIKSGADELAKQLQAMRVLQKSLVWKSAAVVIAAVLVLVVAAGWLLLDTRKQIQRNKVEASLLQAYNAADVNLCHGKLCANVDVPKDYKPGMYLYVRPRSTVTPTVEANK